MSCLCCVVCLFVYILVLFVCFVMFVCLFISVTDWLCPSSNTVLCTSEKLAVRYVHSNTAFTLAVFYRASTVRHGTGVNFANANACRAVPYRASRHG